MKLLLLRHAQSIGNQQGRMEGQLGTGISRLGHHQAHGLAQTLQTEGWLPTHVYCSPLQRALETAAILLEYLDPLPELVYDPKLQELNGGILQNLTWSEAQQLYPDLCHTLETVREWIPVPGAESVHQGRDRAEQFWHQLMTKHPETDQIWIVSHGGILQHLISALLGCDRTWGFEVGPTACFEFWLDRGRWFEPGGDRWNRELWQIRRFNDQQHLQGQSIPLEQRQSEVPTD